MLTSSFKQQIILILSYCNDNDWEKKRQQAQPYINKIRSALEKKTRWYEQIGFLRKCTKEGLVPKGLRVRLPVTVLRSEYGERLKKRSEKRVMKRAISDLFVKIQRVDRNLAGLRLYLNQSLGFSNKWVQKMENWVVSSLRRSSEKVKSRLQRKFKALKDNQIQESRAKQQKRVTVKKKVVYNNSS